MILWMILKVALKSLMANKLRSILAMLGIIIGVGAVIAMLAIGAGTQASVMGRISAMGTNLLVVRPGQRGTGGVMSGTQQNMTLDDATALLTQVRGIRAIAPVVSGNGQLKYFGKNARATVMGTSITYMPIRAFEIERGEMFTEQDVERMARVAVIGPVTAENLFGASDPIGQTMKVNGINFRVVGLIKSKGDQGYFNPDDQLIVPYTTAMKQLFGLDYLREIDIQAKEDADLTQLQADALAVLRKRHRLQPGTPDDVNIRNQADLLETANEVSKKFTVLLGAIAGISLLVGGIGIMNIMLVTVTERTREIGIRKAIGAKDRDILNQFLIEALVMSALGGLLGVGMGVGSAEILGRFTDFATIVKPYSIFLALGFSAAVGIFFGYYPATRAAKLDPIECLRYE
ncbi:MAG: MacB-like periplasmic core domain containing protein [Phycisphaerales bacterium]|nr:MacB-like periplasmic core domain containing protein [Phycisphaerales bacterium]